MMSGLSKLGTALSVVFVVSLAVLVAELFYVLWRRRVFRRQIAVGDGGDHPDSFSTSTSSKDLLYFLCCKHRSKVEPDGGGAAPTPGADGSSPDSPAAVIDVLKLQEMYGPSSRVLFTIKEEREEAESEKSLSLSSTEKVPKTKKRVSLEECFGVAGDAPELAVMVVGVDIQTTPFSTPCASPIYYTPSASPVRESDSGLPVGGV